jgi:hypothetical protein
MPLLKTYHKAEYSQRAPGDVALLPAMRRRYGLGIGDCEAKGLRWK